MRGSTPAARTAACASAEHVRAVRAVQAPVHADHRVVLHQHVVGGGVGDAAAGEADDEVAALEGDDPAGRVEQVAADGVEHDVDAAAVGHVAHGLDEVEARRPGCPTPCSAPSERASSTLAGPPAVASTPAPAAAASCTAAEPVPPAAAWTSTVSPACSPPRWNSPTHAVP